MAKINPTAIVDPRAELAEDVEIGPYCIVESDVKIGLRIFLLQNSLLSTQ